MRKYRPIRISAKEHVATLKACGLVFEDPDNSRHIKIDFTRPDGTHGFFTHSHSETKDVPLDYVRSWVRQSGLDPLVYWETYWTKVRKKK